MSKRYIVYISSEGRGYYKSYLSEKEFNLISDIVAILKDEEKAKEMVKEKSKLVKLDYKEVEWEE